MTQKIVKLLKKETVADGTMAFQFERPADFDFKAGQSIDLTLPNPPETDTEGNTRAFSLSSAPSEDHLMITTRMRNTAFKRVIKDLPLGNPLMIDGPFGSMTLHNDTSKVAVFLAGGIGVTPFRSMIVEAAIKKLPHRIYLFYSNRKVKDAAFLEELQNLTKQNKNFYFIPTMTETDGPNQTWSGETGYINETTIKKFVSDTQQAIYYMAGPPSMVAAMHTMLSNFNINDDNIRSESFAGY